VSSPTREVTTTSTAERVDAMLRPERPREVFRWVVTGVGLALFVWGLSGDMKWSRLVEAPAEFVNIATLMFTDPEWSIVPHLLAAMWESISIAWLGTVFATIVAIPMSFLAAENLVGRPVSWVTRQLFNVLRAVPELILAVAFIPIFGLTATAGVMAIAVGSVGTLGKLCYEVIEGLDRGPIEAADAVGANRPQRLRWGVLPQVLPELTSFALYRFEVNIRASAVLGVVGAGGIGRDLSQYVQFKAWERVGLALVVVVVSTILVDTISGRIRRRIVAGPDGTGGRGGVAVVADHPDGGAAVVDPASVVGPDEDLQQLDHRP
jgi:phosphonate transport system permease protein